MKKIAAIYNKRGSTWLSCQKITANILKVYQELARDYQIDYFDINQEINLDGFNKLIFIDHTPHPWDKTLQLLQQNQIKSDAELIYYIYGDFSLNLRKWYELICKLDNYKIKLVVASNAQKKLLKKLIHANITVIPFPVDTKEFHHVPNPLAAQTFLYTGRISFQKNIHQCIKLFYQSYQEGILDNDFKFIIAGNYDSIGRPFLGQNELEGEYYHYLNYKLREEVSSAFFNKHISFVGLKNGKELYSLYNQAAYFISLSHFNDEDFGMSVAESLSCGLPCLLSNWGGHASFKQSCPDLVELVEFEVKSNDFVVNYNSFKKKLLNLLKKSKQVSNQSFAISSIAQLTDLMLSDECSKHEIKASSKFVQVMNQIKKVDNIFGDGKQYRPLYWDLYGDYY